MATRLGIPTNLYRKGHPVLSPDGNPTTPLGLASFLEAAAPTLRPADRAGLSGLPFTFDTEPPPLTVCAFDTSHHELHCLGLARGKIEPIAHEHFTVWQGQPGVGTQPVNGDSFWYVTQTGPQSGSASAISQIPSIADGHGVIAITSRSASGSVLTVGKGASSISQLAGGALWCRARIYIPSSPGLTSMIIYVGFMDQVGGSQLAAIHYNSAAGPTFYGVTQNGAVAAIPLPHIVTTNTWYDLEIFTHGDQGFTSFWVNGAGGGSSYTITTNVPTGALNPSLQISPSSASARTLYADLMFTDVIRGADVRHPLLDPVLARAA